MLIGTLTAVLTLYLRQQLLMSTTYKPGTSSSLVLIRISFSQLPLRPPHKKKSIKKKTLIWRENMLIELFWDLDIIFT